MSVLTLSPYPLSGRFADELERRHGPLEQLTITELRREPPRRAVRRLLAARGTVLLAVETPSAEGALPALQATAALTRGSAFLICRPGAAPIPASRAAVFRALADSGRASLAGFEAVVATRADARRLVRLPRTVATPDLEAGILLLNPSPWLGLAAGGALSHLAGVANAFADRGHSVEVATYGELPGLRAGVANRPLPRPQGYGLPPEVNRFRLARAAGAITASSGLVYERASVGSLAGVAVSRRLGVPLVLEYNGSELWIARNWGGTTRFAATAAAAEEATLRHAHLVVTVSQVLADELVARGVEAGRVVWHPNGVDADRFDPERFGEAERAELRARYGIPHDAVLGTFVGTFGTWHGAEVLARAMRSASPPGFHALFVGDGPRMAEVRALLEGVPNATLAGIVDPAAIPLHLAASDVLVAPHVENPDGSAFFGSPTKLFEYMAAGRAIVASSLGQLADVLDGGCAILVRPGDADDLARGLAQAAGDPLLRSRLGRSARARVLERYTWKHQTDAILAAVAALPRPGMTPSRASSSAH